MHRPGEQAGGRCGGIAHASEDAQARLRLLQHTLDVTKVEQGKPMIDVAKSLADKDAKIILVNVVEDVPARVTMVLPDDAHQKIIEHAESELKAMAKLAGPDVEAVIRDGHPPSEIIELSKEKGADLIIVASHRPDWHDYLLGSTAARVVRHAQCSVLVAR